VEQVSGSRGAPLAMINGQPAMVFAGIDLRYLRAADTNGMRWPASSAQVTPDNVLRSKLVTVNSRPAVAYVENGTFNIKYVRASDANGTTWPASINVVSSASAIFDVSMSMAIIAGRPAIVYDNSADGSVWYVRALDADGNAWGTPSKVDAGRWPDLVEVNSLPAISYDWTNGQPEGSPTYTNQVRFIRGTDANGAAWSAAVPVATFGLFQQRLGQTHLLIVAGNPAIFFASFDLATSTKIPRFVRASNSTGTSWGTPVPVTFAAGVFLSGQYGAALVNGQPAIAWRDDGHRVIHYSFSRDNGASFGNLPVFEFDVGPGPAVSLLDVNGLPALTFSDGDETFYFSEATPVADTYVNWIAVEP